MDTDILKVKQSIGKLEKWVERKQYKSYEPFDGLSSYLRLLTCNNQFLERLLQQLVRQSPVNLRPLLGIKPQESTKGRGYMAWGYIHLYKITNQPLYRDNALDCLAWLDNNKAPHYEFHSWGNHFDFTSRGGRLNKLEPIIVWTSLIGQAYIDAYELFNEKRHLEIIESIAQWILSLPREKTQRGACLSYVAYRQSSIHNSNMLGAAFLARAAKYINNKNALNVAKDAMEYSCSRQLPNGAWYYGEKPNMHWIDNFHTGYNLDSLKYYRESTNDTQYDENLRKGFDFYIDAFFEKTGRPKYYHNRTYPVDSQCAAQAVDTLAFFSDYDSSALPMAIKVAQWWIDTMQSRDGYFYYRQYPGGIKAKMPMLHWAQATTYKAFALLLQRLLQESRQ